MGYRTGWMICLASLLALIGVIIYHRLPLIILSLEAFGLLALMAVIVAFMVAAVLLPPVLVTVYAWRRWH